MNTMKKIFILLLMINLFENLYSNTRKIHFSIDDVNQSLEDLTKNEFKYDNLFDDGYWSYLKKLHEKTGAIITLYCIYKTDTFCLNDCTTKFQNDFRNNSDWLKFGYHCYDNNNTFSGNSYNNYLDAIVRITGGYSCISNCLRLDRFSGSLDEIKNTRNAVIPIKQLLTADDKKRDSYYLDSENLNKLHAAEKLEKDGIQFFETDFRFDDLDNYKKLSKESFNEMEVIVFTHEWLIRTKPRKNIPIYIYSKIKEWRIKINIKKTLKAAKNKGYIFVDSL